MPFGFNRFGSQFERVLPASAVGNMFPFNFSGKTDPKGFYIGRDKYGTNILVDLDRRGDDKTNSNVLILGNSGQGKSYLMKLLLTNLRESGKRVLVMDAEGEYGDLAVNTYTVPDTDDRRWKVVSDSSIRRQARGGREASRFYSVEVVSPICRYEDIETVQELVRQLRHAGAMVNDSCGIHIHVDASRHDAKTLRNIVNIMASKEDLLYKALRVQIDRQYYCQKADLRFLDDVNLKHPKSMEELERLWYNGDSRRYAHYDQTRYHALNLHSVFSKGTIEFRMFNSTLHAGEVKSYIQLCLAISHQALTQKCASRNRTQSENEKYTFRTWLLRLGLIGDEFKTARQHLLKNLDGNIAWKDPAQAERQKERLLRQRLEQAHSSPEPAQEVQQEGEMTMQM